MKFHLKEIAQIVNGQLVGCNNFTDNVLFDSRDTNRNYHSLFLAIHSKSRNGHNYIADMIKCGVLSYIVEEEFAIQAKQFCETNNHVGFIVVKNSISAIQTLAKHHRQSINVPIIAIVGSNGKTITKEWFAQLHKNKNIARSPKSFNSQFGVALSLLMIQGDESLAIIEAGISEKGEMEILEQIIKPTGVVFTNVNSAHIENFGSPNVILAEKAQILKNADFVVYNKSNSLLDSYICSTYPKIETFCWGEGKGVNIKSQYNKTKIKFEYNNHSYDQNPAYYDFGSYENMMNAISLVAKIDGDIEFAVSQIQNLESIEMRLQLTNGINNCRIVNDVYSNDIHSLTIALNYLSSISPDQNRVVIISDFIQSNDSIYPMASKLLNKYGIEKIYSIGSKIGKLLDNLNCPHVNYKTTEDFCRELNKHEFTNKSILIKGGRLFSFEKIASLLQDKMHSTELIVDLEALINNYKILQSKLSQKTKTVAMVKAFGYGSGNYEIAAALCETGVDYLAVAYLDEGITLREKGITKSIIILNSTSADFEQIVKYKLQPEIYSKELLSNFVEFCKMNNLQDYPIHIKLDTGMNRLGFQYSDLEQLCEILLSSSNEIKVDSIFSHLSSADDSTKDDITRLQIQLFDNFSSRIIEIANLSGVNRHICNSAGAMRFPEAHFDMVRFGIALYGIYPIKGLKSISSLHSTILHIKKIKKGESVGYNQMFISKEDMQIAIVGVGYADGLNRKLSCGNWAMKINGQPAITIGNISMDNCAVNITGLDISIGDRITIFETSEEIESMANKIGTISYEVLTSISNRIKRTYYK